MESTDRSFRHEALQRRTRRARRHSGGAVFVEALVVISVFILFLLGIIFFRELYVKKLNTMRLARAGAIAHAMAACKPDIRSILPVDPSNGPAVTQRSDTMPFEAERNRNDPSNSGKMFDRVAEGRGGTVLNEINEVSLSTSAQATSKPSRFESELGFRGTVTSSSYVSCGDELSTAQYKEMSSLIGNFFNEFL